jgi:hypothetical protein
MKSSTRTGSCGLLLALVIIALTPAPAQAQWLATPYLGINLAGDAEFRRGGPGGAIGYLGSRLGFEFDVQRYNHFFKDANVDLIPNNCVPGVSSPCVDLNTDAWSLMGNVIAPIGGKGRKWRPYGTVGVGVIKPWIEGGGSGSRVSRDGEIVPGAQADPIHVSQTNVAINAGAGVIRALNGRVGLRADVRYFFAFVDETNRTGAYFKDYGFLRATVGVTLRLHGN